MLIRSSLALGVLLLAATWGAAQTVAPPGTAVPSTGWRNVGGTTSGPAASAAPTSGAARIPSTFRDTPATPASATTPVVGGGSAAPTAMVPVDAKSGAAAGSDIPRRPLTRVTEGPATLPNTQGQVWREYDISPYTMRVTSTNRPEQAIVDWILRETGYEVWHSEPLGVLSANKTTLRVYHTPQMHNTVSEIVDRFVRSEAETRSFSARVVTLDQPNWRARVQQMLHPVAAQTPGVQAWLLEREDAAMLLADLRRRSDFREHNAPNLLVNNGQSAVVSTMRGRQYVRDIVMRNNAWPGYEIQPGQVDEGFALEFNPLLSLDGRLIDAMVKCDIEQVEKMVPVDLDVPTAGAPRQRTQIEVPQLSHCRFQERFRWPVDQVLLVNLGMVALPFPAETRSLIPGLPLALGSAPMRADLLIFLESRTEANQPARPVSTADRTPLKYHGRY
jgi:hypothetical protein